MVNYTQVKNISVKCIADIESLGYSVPKGIKWEISHRMSRAFGACHYGQGGAITIKINGKLPVEIAHHTIAHELIHAVFGYGEHHGQRFQRLARQLKPFGYTIGTYAAKENVAVYKGANPQLAERQQARKAQLVCGTCGHVYNVSVNSKFYRNPAIGKCGHCKTSNLKRV